LVLFAFAAADANRADDPAVPLQGDSQQFYGIAASNDNRIMIFASGRRRRGGQRLRGADPGL